MSRYHSLARFALLAPLMAVMVASGVSASEDGIDISSELPAPSDETALPTRDAAPADSEMIADEVIAEVESPEPTPASTSTWHFYSRENCFDMFTQGCYQSHFPDPFCPSSNPAGQACSPVGSRCWVIISNWWADEYVCKF